MFIEILNEFAKTGLLTKDHYIQDGQHRFYQLQTFVEYNLKVEKELTPGFHLERRSPRVGKFQLQKPAALLELERDKSVYLNHIQDVVYGH